MLHDIAPQRFYCEYKRLTPQRGDFILAFAGEDFCLKEGAGESALLRFEDFSADAASFRYLFSIDAARFFLAPEAILPRGALRRETGFFRTMEPRWLSFAGITGHQLYLWYAAHRLCGRCGAAMRHAEAERSVRCGQCGLTAYPQISPVVIVGVFDGNRLLMTRYARGPYKRYALVAGFAEIGEALEDTARREVLEETGVRVKNPRYYKSQPWGFSSSLLSGFFAELDGDARITLDRTELAEAVWLERGDLPPTDNNISLTAEMIEAFRAGKAGPEKSARPAGA
jgi:NAD+ diphosphatase